MRKPPTVALVLGLFAAACSGSSGDTTTTSVEMAPSTTVAATTTTAAPATTTSSDTSTTQASSGGGGSDCLVGTWVLDSEAFVENFGSIFADAGMPDAEVSPLDGSFTVDLSADGSLEAERDEWGFRITMPDSTIIFEIDGTETGSWSADDSTPTVDTVVSDLKVSAAIEVGDQVVALPEGQMPIETPPGIASGSDYTCAGDVLTLSNAGVESVLDRA
jgi:hypothetical protein